ncbi:transposable element Tcb2 transposase [Trichonephila clavipes]|nr:transposable element Tcb2 transposase [Trichonephila clavipes]
MQRLRGVIFQQDNARPHTARVSQDCLRTVTTLPWPARSPDLFPIEHNWDHLGWQVKHPTSLNEPEASYMRAFGDEPREDDRLGVIGKVLAFVRNGRYPERTIPPSLVTLAVV